MYINYDSGRGSFDAWLVVTSGKGIGLLASWWTKLNRGPGLAMVPAANCGHRWPHHCNSAYCRSWWCNLPSTMLGKLLCHSHGFRVWCGPAYHRRSFVAWLAAWRYLRLRRRLNPHVKCYKLILIG